MERRNAQSAHLDTILSCRCDDFAGVELQRSYSVIILQSFKDTASPDVPYLQTASEMGIASTETITYSDGLIQTTADDMNLVELEARHRSRMSHKRAMSLSSAHYSPREPMKSSA